MRRILRGFILQEDLNKLINFLKSKKDKLINIMNNNEKKVNETVLYNFNDTIIKEFIKKVFDEYL